MSEDKDKKTEEPSHRKLEEARKKGQVPKSKEVVSAIVLLIATVYFYLFWDNLIQHLQDIILAPAKFYHLDFDTAKSLILRYIMTIGLLYIVLPFVATLFLITLLANIAQFGFLFVTDPIMPKLEKISIISGFGRIFSSKTLVDTSLSLLKIILISTVIWYVMNVALSVFPNYPGQCDLTCYRLIGQSLTLKLIALLIPLFMVLAIIDYMVQKHEFTKQQRMTKDEAKRDYKNTEGDPFVKSVRKSLHFEMLYDDFEDRVKYSRIIITDYNKGVALSYREGMELPVIMCKSSGGMLSKLLSIARQEDVPVIENTTLTHSLFEDGAIDEYIPQATITKVAEAMK